MLMKLKYLEIRFESKRGQYVTRNQTIKHYVRHTSTNVDKVIFEFGVIHIFSVCHHKTFNIKIDLTVPGYSITIHIK